MRTETIKVYSYDELKPDIQEKVRDEFRKDYDFTFENEYLKERFEEVAENEGFSKATFLWSLGNCQGDGVSFECKEINLNIFLKRQNLLTRYKWLLKKNVVFSVTRSGHHYCHKYMVDVDYETYDDLTEKQEAKSEELIKLMEKAKNDICNRCEKIGYEAYEYRLSDKSIEEEIRANEYGFLADGNLWS